MNQSSCSEFIDDELSSVCCEICFEPFNHISRQPKLLPCGHNFCESCIFSICCHQEFYLLDSINCPTCRRPFGTGVARTAPTNYDLCKILEQVQKKKEQNITVIYVPEAKKSTERSVQKDSHQRCAECSRKIPQKSFFRVARFCVDCTSTSRMTVVCLECCVNQHNGHQLLTEDELHANQLKVLSELRSIRRKVLAFSKSFDEKTKQAESVRPSLAVEKANLETYTLSSIDDVIGRIELAPIMFPPVLQSILSEQRRNLKRLNKLSIQLDKCLLARRNNKPTQPLDNPSTSFADAPGDSLWHESVHRLCEQFGNFPMCLQLQFHHSTISPKDTIEERKRKIISCAHAATCMLDDGVPIDKICLFADVLLNSFHQLDQLSKSKFYDKRTFKRADIWKQVQISYTDLLNIVSKNLASYHPQRVEIIDDLAFLCFIYSDVCDQATVTICIIEAARARAADLSALSEEEQADTQRMLKMIDHHLTECRRKQKLLELCTTKTSKKKSLKKLFARCIAGNKC